MVSKIKSLSCGVKVKVIVVACSWVVVFFCFGFFSFCFCRSEGLRFLAFAVLFWSRYSSGSMCFESMSGLGLKVSGATGGKTRFSSAVAVFLLFLGWFCCLGFLVFSVKSASSAKSALGSCRSERRAVFNLHYAFFLAVITTR